MDQACDDYALSEIAASDCSCEARAELRALDQVLRRLSVRARLVWSLRHIEGMTHDELAHACDCSIATVKRDLANAETVVDKHVRQLPLPKRIVR